MRAKGCEVVGPEHGGIPSDVLSGLVVASRGEDVARHIGPLYALIGCPRCCAKEVHSALDTAIVHDLHAIWMVSRKMATLMECKACSGTGILISHDYDDDRDYYLQCDDFIPLANGAKTLKDWSGLHRFLGFYVVSWGSA